MDWIRTREGRPESLEVEKRGKGNRNISHLYYCSQLMLCLYWLTVVPTGLCVSEMTGGTVDANN